jgi:hypothetical protein
MSSNINSNNNKINAEQVKVCIRMRPLLPPYEDEDVWGIDYKENKVFSTNNNNLANAMDPMTLALGG